MNYKKEYKKYLTAAVLDNANNKIMSSTFLIAFAIYLGISDKSIGIYIILDTITNIFQLLAAPIFSKIGQSKKIVLANYSLYRISSILPAFIPFITEDIGLRTILFMLFGLFYSIFGKIGYITFVNWRMTLLTKEDRSRFYATKNLFKNTVVMIFSLTTGIILDYFTKSGQELVGFILLFLLVTFISAIDIIIRSKTYKPKIVEVKTTLRESIQRPAFDRNFRKILVFCGFYNISLVLGTMYLSLYLIKYIGISYTYISTLVIISSLSEAFFSYFWSSVFRKKRWDFIIVPALVVLITVFLLLFLINDITFILPLIYILLGLVYSAYGLFDNIAIYESSHEKYKTSYVSFERFVSGLTTLLIPIILSFVLTEEENISNIKITFVLAVIFLVITLLVYIYNFIAKKNINY